MSERPRVKIRGIYATALSGMLKEKGFLIVRPSSVTAKRFGLRRGYQAEEVEVRDKEDRQGVILRGDKAEVEQVLEALRRNLPEVVVRNKALMAFEKAWKAGQSFKLSSYPEIELEFPAEVKRALDDWRSRFVPTLAGHHLFRLINSEELDRAEEELSRSPGRAGELAEDLKRRLIFSHYREGRELSIQHVKPDGEVIFLSEGRIERFDRGQRSLLLKRWRYKGRGKYDGLNLPKEEGDFALTEAEEGSWVLKHAYFDRQGSPKGEFYNINTPIEFYPDGIRYIDLEVDVVRWPDGRVKLTDETDLERAVNYGFIGRELADRALRIARELEAQLRKT